MDSGEKKTGWGWGKGCGGGRGGRRKTPDNFVS